MYSLMLCLCFSISQLQVHKSLAVPGGSVEGYSACAHFVKAHNSVFGRQWFSDIAILGHPPNGSDADETELWYAKTLLMFHVGEGNDQTNWVFIKYYGISREVDKWTQCRLLSDEMVGYRLRVHQRETAKYEIMPIDSIVRAIHVVKSFTRRGVYFLNEHLIY
jgi:hypothetical protein